MVIQHIAKEKNILKYIYDIDCYWEKKLCNKKISAMPYWMIFLVLINYTFTSTYPLSTERFCVCHTNYETNHSGLAKIPALDWGTESDIINQKKWSPFLATAVIWLNKMYNFAICTEFSIIWHVLKLTQFLVNEK